MKPVVAIYSTFLQRGYDQLIHDICIQNLPVLFAIDRAGLVGADGATHAGSFDFSYLRCLPNMKIMAPADENECRQMLYTGFMQDGPVAVRYPRGSGPGVAVDPDMQAIPLGKGEIRRKGKRLALLAFGSMLAPSLEAGEAFDATVVNMRWVKPLDQDLVRELVNSHELLITIEENAVAGGAGSAVGEFVLAQGLTTNVINLGLPDQFIEHGDHKSQLAKCGLDASGIRRAILRYAPTSRQTKREFA
jgi:1-deoxy-D-xylulose-5-phosphate synthase